MDFPTDYPRIVIPSYNRPEVLRAKTFRFLQSVDYPLEKIFIFVASQEEYIKYKTEFLELPHYNIIVGVLGLINQRNFISDFLNDEEIYISMDDDITGIKCPFKNFNQILELGLQAIHRRETGIFGIRPNDNGLCLKDTTTTHLSHIVGAFYIIRNHQELRVRMYLEDYERTILYFLRYRQILRYNGAGIATKYIGSSAGAEGAALRQENGVREIVARYPGLCKAIIKKNGWPDISLNWRVKINLTL
jgi:hypothetical protein